MLEHETNQLRPQVGSRIGSTAQRWPWIFVQAAVVSALTLYLLFWNLTNYPKPWFDEGYFIAVAKTIATAGQYAVPDSGGNWVMDPSITSGPPLILPLAATFWLFGVGTLQARLLAALFGLVTLGLYLALARRLNGAAAAWLALLLLLAGAREPLASFVPLARMAMGEVPAFGWLLGGVLIWWRALDQRPAHWQPGRLALAGLALGLAIVTKPQLAVAVVPALLLLAALDRWHYRVAPLRAYALPLGVLLLTVGGWMAIQFGYGPAASGRAAVLSAGVRSNILGIDAVHIRHALGTIWRSGFLLWGVPGLAYGCWLARQRGAVGLRHAWLLAPTLIGLGWFVVFSIGWPRYAFVPFALAPIWTAALIQRLLSQRSAPQRLLGTAAIGAALLALSIPIVTPLAQTQDQGGAQLSSYIQQQLPPDAVIETWEWDLAATVNHPMHHPPPLVMYAYIDAIQRDQPPPTGMYRPAPEQAHYLVDGPFSNWVGIYAPTIAERGTLVAQFGRYALYRLADAPSDTPPTSSRNS